MMAESPIKFFKAHGFDILALPLITVRGLCLITMAEVEETDLILFPSVLY